MVDRPTPTSSLASRATHPAVRLRLPDGAVVDLLAGDLVGRAGSAALQLDDARVSEAHAMVSLRGGALRLLGLRGRFAVDGKVVSETDLLPGVTVWLTPDLPLEVVTVVLPEGVLALEGDGLPRQVLRGATSLVFDPRPALVRGVRGSAKALFWRTGSQWRMQRSDEPTPHDLTPGLSWTLDGHTFRAVLEPLDTLSGQTTVVQGSHHAPLRLVTHYDTVQIHRENEAVCVIGGLGARILSELVACDGPVNWRVLYGEIWGDGAPEHRGRQKLDAALVRVRRKLESARLPRDLVQADGSGQTELVLREGDRVEDLA